MTVDPVAFLVLLFLASFVVGAIVVMAAHFLGLDQ